jgi:hypothetical protein
MRMGSFNKPNGDVSMKEYHVIGNQRVNGNFRLYVKIDDFDCWLLWKKFNDLEDCYSEKFVIPNLHDSKIVEVAEDGSREEVLFYMD